MALTQKSDREPKSSGRGLGGATTDLAASNFLRMDGSSDGQHSSSKQALPNCIASTEASSHGNTNSKQAQSKQQLVLSIVMLSIFFTFAYDTFSYSIGDAYFGRHWIQQGAGSSVQLAAAYGVYGTTNLAATVALLAIQVVLPTFLASVSASTARQLSGILASLVLSSVAGAFTAVWTDNYATFIACRALQGMFSAYYFVQALVLISVRLPSHLQRRAIVVLNTGLAVGDSIAPFLGGVLFDTLGIRAANGSQTIASVPAILLMWATFVLHSSSALTLLPKYVLGVTQPPSPTRAAADSPTSNDPVHSSFKVLLDDHGKEQGQPLCRSQIVHMLKDRYVLSQCSVVFLVQMMIQMVDILLPLVLVSKRLWMLALAYGFEAIGSIVLPWLLDWALNRWRVDTHTLQVALSICFCVASGSVLHATDYLALVYACFFIIGGGHGCIETLVYTHVADHAGEHESVEAVHVSMCIFSVFFIGGFTAGSYLIGVAHSQAGYRALAMYGAAATLLYAICLVLLIRLRWVTSRKPASGMEMTVTPPIEGPASMPC